MASNDLFFDTSLIFALLNGKVSSALNRRLNHNFKSGGLPHINADKWAVLQNLYKKDGVTQQMLCDNTKYDKPSMTRLIDSLEEQGLVLRRVNKEDKRERRILLTVAGRELEEKASYIANRTLKESLRGLTPDEIRICQEVLRKVFINSSR
ncbi:MAG: MarR family transcriptional regulator [Bacteroidaceae bacterium]|nr:MarR family transcriptional regulator [Blautia sp.]MCF0186667.1 MarR family transcriptional regulator [Bacteroidaceae bacterium]